MYEENNVENVIKDSDSKSNIDFVKSIELLEKENILLKAKIDENFDLFLRSKAEADNIKKRADKEIDNIVKYSTKNFFLDLLPLLDSLESCLTSDNKEHDREGIKIFYKMLGAILEKYNVKKISVDVNNDFDPLLHEVISVVESDEFDNKVNSVVQSGYVLYDQVLRYSKVTVFKKI